VTAPEFVHIHYLRPPDRKEIFRQRLLLDTPTVKVTFAEQVPFDPPIRIGGEVALEAGSDAVWFTFPGTWHDVGRFHRADGTFTGMYANILTPPLIREDGVWHTIDLYLDVWVDTTGSLMVLDEDQMAEAVAQGWVSPETALRAEAEVQWITERFREGKWPPPVVDEWTLDRARQVVSGVRS